MYLTYEEYQTMGGTLDETAFNDFEFEAECIINWYTFDRLKGEDTYPDELKRCMNSLIKLAKMKADALALGSQTVTTRDAEGNIVSTTETSAPIASQSNDGVSISYNVLGASNIFSELSATKRGSEVDNTIKHYLHGVVNSLGRKLLYRGLYPNE